MGGCWALGRGCHFVSIGLFFLRSRASEGLFFTRLFSAWRAGLRRSFAGGVAGSKAGTDILLVPTSPTRCRTPSSDRLPTAEPVLRGA